MAVTLTAALIAPAGTRRTAARSVSTSIGPAEALEHDLVARTRARARPCRGRAPRTPPWRTTIVDRSADARRGSRRRSWPRASTAPVTSVTRDVAVLGADRGSPPTFSSVMPSKVRLDGRAPGHVAACTRAVLAVHLEVAAHGLGGDVAVRAGHGQAPHARGGDARRAATSRVARPVHVLHRRRRRGGSVSLRSPLTPLACTSPCRAWISAGPPTRSSAHGARRSRDRSARATSVTSIGAVLVARPSPRVPGGTTRSRCVSKPDLGLADDAARSSSRAVGEDAQRRAPLAQGLDADPVGEGARLLLGGEEDDLAQRDAHLARRRPGRSCTPPKAFSTWTGVSAATASRLVGGRSVKDGPWNLPPIMNQPQGPAPAGCGRARPSPPWSRRRGSRSSRPILLALHEDLRASRSTDERPPAPARPTPRG